MAGEEHIPVIRAAAEALWPTLPVPAHVTDAGRAQYYQLSGGWSEQRLSKVLANMHKYLPHKLRVQLLL